MKTNYIRHQISGWPGERVSINGNNRGKWCERSPEKLLKVMDVSVILIVVVWLHEWKHMPKPNKLYIWIYAVTCMSVISQVVVPLYFLNGNKVIPVPPHPG